MRLAVVFLATAWGCAAAQADVASALNFEQLKAKAKESVDVSLDASTLQFAGGFLSGKKGTEADAKKVIEGVKGLFVRSFEFAEAGAYTEADLRPVRALAQAPGWSRVVDINEGGGEKTEIYTKTENGRPAGLIVIAAEKKELTIVYVDGPVDLQKLAELGGKFGIPQTKGAK